MRGPDSDPEGQEIAGALMAVDATLAGDPVDPQYAELAELALILRRERPRTSDTFTARLDERVERRFARPAPVARGTGLRRWLGGSVAGLAAAAAGVAVVLVVAGSHGGASSSSSSSAAETAVSSAAASASAGGAAGKPLLSVAPAIREAKHPSAAACGRRDLVIVERGRVLGGGVGHPEPGARRQAPGGPVGPARAQRPAEPNR